jgi:hypothetical protein
MPRRAAPIPPITPVPRDLGLEEACIIIEAAVLEEERRIELVGELRAALERNDIPQVVEIARRICGLEGAV